MMDTVTNLQFGIDDISFYVPKLYLPIGVLAEHRGVEFAKLNKGLGLNKMAFNDVHEDVATMGANAALELIQRNNIDPRSLGRLYLGTESALDSAKPTVTFIMGMLRDKLSAQYGKDCFDNCDATDITFACIGAVDALQNCLDWVRSNPKEIAIVISSDLAKYDVGSTGEYTQGSGAVAMIVKAKPRLLSLGDSWGVATENVFDFFKPRRNFSKLQMVQEVLDLATDLNEQHKQNILKSASGNPELFGVKESSVDIFKETPIFDGQYSNACYQKQIHKAYFNLKKRKRTDEVCFESWEHIIFHLPYAFHGKRIFTEIFVDELKGSGSIGAIEQELGLKCPEKDDEQAYQAFIKLVSKSVIYREFCKKKMAKSEVASGQIGNMYSASVFMALVSFLYESLCEGIDISKKKIGFVAYGSGAKSKVFEATINSGWSQIVRGITVKQQLENRIAIDYSTYDKLHKKQLQDSVVSPKNEFSIKKVSKEPNTLGATHYRWND